MGRTTRLVVVALLTLALPAGAADPTPRPGALEADEREFLEKHWRRAIPPQGRRPRASLLSSARSSRKPAAPATRYSSATGRPRSIQRAWGQAWPASSWKWRGGSPRPRDHARAATRPSPSSGPSWSKRAGSSPTPISIRRSSPAASSARAATCGAASISARRAGTARRRAARRAERSRTTASRGRPPSSAPVLRDLPPVRRRRPLPERQAAREHLRGVARGARRRAGGSSASTATCRIGVTSGAASTMRTWCALASRSP